jgi:ankyrin repeat protein
MKIPTPDDLHKLLRTAYCSRLIAETPAGDNGWVDSYIGTIGDCALRRDHDTFGDGVGISERHREWHLFFIEDDSLVVCRQADENSERLSPKSKPYAKAIEAFWQFHDRIVLLQARDDDTARRTALVMEAGKIAARPPADITLDAARWRHWIERLLEMQEIAQRRGWALEPLAIAPPASNEAVERIERQAGLALPGQLRAIVEGFSAEIRFGWRPSRDDKPRGALSSLYSGGMRGAVWSLWQAEDYAIGNFEGWRFFFFGRGESDDERECANTPEMWEKQFAIGHLPNGDMLTIDCKDPRAEHQPVRYFSHEAEGIHGEVLAPNLFAFLDQWIALGCAGDEQSQWFCVLDEENRLDADGEVGRAWRAWLRKDPKQRGADEAPQPILAKTAEDARLLDAAKADDFKSVKAAVAAGARIDCSPDDWQDENHTALIYAAKHDNLKMLEWLKSQGASLSTALLPLVVALRESSVDTCLWLIDNGSRVNRWIDDRYCPLHVLMDRPDDDDPQGEHYKRLMQALLARGADPNAAWDLESIGRNTTALMRSGPWTAAILLRHGADPMRRDAQGLTAMHHAERRDVMALLKQHGLPIDALSDANEHHAAHTPLQHALLDYDDPVERVEALLAEGADPRALDSNGLDAWWYSRHTSTSKRLLALGFSADAADPSGGHLLHHILRENNGILYQHHTDHAKFLVKHGLDIRRQDAQGDTVLHVVARLGDDDKSTTATLNALIKLGAIAKQKNRAGRTPVSLLKPSFKRSLKSLSG